MRFVRTLIGIALMGSAFAIWAEPSVRLHADRSTVRVGTPFQLVLEITGQTLSGDITLPDVPGLDIGKRPVNSSTSTQVEIAGFHSTVVKRVACSYAACATQAGKVTIPPVSVNVDGKTIASEPLVLSVLDSSATSSPSQGVSSLPPSSQQTTPPAENSQPEDAADTSPTPSEVTWEDIAFADATTDKKEVYQGESLLLTLSLGKMDLRGLQVGMLRGQGFVLPTTEGFYTVVLQQQSQTQIKRKNWNYGVTQWRIVLCPTISGKLKVGSWHWEGAGLYRLQQQELRFDTPPIEINVKPLPPPPAGFSGAVGSYKVEAQADRASVMQGTPVRFIVKVTGQGSPEGIGAPLFPKIDGAYISDPETDAKTVETATGFTAVKTFTYTITPQKVGALAIPQIPFCYFNPAEGTYKTELTPPFNIEVTTSNESPAPVATVAAPPKKESGHVEVIGDDIHPMITNIGNLKPVRSWLFLSYVVFAVPMIVYCAFVVLMRHKRRMATDQGFARAHGAKSKARKRLRHVTETAEPSEELYRALNGYVADLFNVTEGGMTSSDVAALLQEHGMDSGVAETVEKVLKSCERARYAGVPLSRDEVAALTEAAIVALDQLEAIQKGRRR